MCGRYATTRGSAELSTLFEALDETDGSLVADYNVAPTDPVPVVRMSTRRSARVLGAARWGLVPSWATDPCGGARMINARAETVATTPAYAKPFASRRCLVPADGWYEWVRRPGGKQAYYITGRDPLAFAGLWSAWGPEPLITCSIVTLAAGGDLSLVHSRMPLVLPPSRWVAWLTGTASAALLEPAPDDYLAGLEIRPVGPAVGDVRNDGPSLTSRVAAPPLGAPPDEPVELTLF
jgi:putative SOS response-associated peptidase YedK